MKILLVLTLAIVITRKVFAEPLKVSVYYEALCPDSRRFITKQLYPSFKKLKEYLDIKLIPYGKVQAANKRGIWNFTCQHGPRECYGNKIQSCVIDLNTPTASIEYVNCVMSSKTKGTLKKCAVSSHVDWGSIMDCINGTLANQLFLENGKRTNTLLHKVTYVPTIIFNDIYNATLQYRAEYHFLTTVCRLLEGKPDTCVNNS